MKHFNYSTSFFLVVIFIAFFSSCSTSFQAAKYQHYDYVRSPYTAPQDDQLKMGVLAQKNENELRSNDPNSEVLQLRTVKPSALSATMASTLAGQAVTHSHVGVTTSSIQELQSMANQPQDHVNQSSLQKIQQQIREKSSGLSDLDPDLRKAIIFMVIGLILQFFWLIPDVGFVFGIIGAILLVVGLVYLLVYLLNS